jgi:glycosidase
MMVMLDIVGNHASPTDGNYSSIIPFNKPEHYHSCTGCSEHCSIPEAAYASAEAWPPKLPDADLVKQCRLINLADFNQTNPFVRKGLISWLQNTLRKFPFDAIRMDTVKHVETVSCRGDSGQIVEYTLSSSH